MPDWWYSLKLNTIEILISERHYHSWRVVNTLRPRQNGCHSADDIFKRIFDIQNIWILINVSLRFVPRGPIDNIPALVQIMAWRQPGDKPLSEPMMVSLLTHICITGPQWVNARSQGIITHRHIWTSITHMVFHIYHVHGLTAQIMHLTTNVQSKTV